MRIIVIEILFVLLTTSCQFTNSKRIENADTIVKSDSLIFERYLNGDSFTIDYGYLKELCCLIKLDSNKVNNQKFIQINKNQCKTIVDSLYKNGLSPFRRINVPFVFQKIYDIPNTNFVLISFTDQCIGMTCTNVLTLWVKNNNKLYFHSFIDRVWYIGYGSIEIDYIFSISKTQIFLMISSSGADGDSSWGELNLCKINIPDKMEILDSRSYSVQGDFQGNSEGYLYKQRFDSINREIILEKYHYKMSESKNINEQKLIETSKIKLDDLLKKHSN